MEFILWGMVLYAAMKFLAPRAVTVYSVAREYSLGIAAPSPSTIVVPTTVSASPVLASIVLASESSCLASDFTSTLWFSPSATATTTSIPVFSPIDIPEPVTIEALAPGLFVTDSVCIAVILATITAVLILCACLSGRVERPVALPEMSYSESIVAGTDYDWHKSDSLGSAGRFVDPETLLGIDILQWHDDKSVQDELKWSAREQAHQSEIDTINGNRDTRERRLQKELETSERRLQTELAAKESAHEARTAAIEGFYRQQLAAIKAKHKKNLADMQTHAKNLRRYRKEEAAMREEAEAKLAALVNVTMLGSGPPMPTVQTQDVAQHAAPISTADQLPPVPVATESSTVETEEASPAEPASPASITGLDSVEPTAETSPQDGDVAPGTGDQRPCTPAAAESPVTEAEVALLAEPAPPATTPGLASVEPTAETSPQDVAPGTGDQIPSPPAATASPFTEAEEESPVAIPSPLTEAEDEFPAATESPSEAESVLSSENGTEQEQEQEEEEEREHEQEQQEDKVEEEPHNSGMPPHEPSSTGEGSEQIPQHQEKGLALGAPVPTEETAATSQLTGLEAAPGAATSDDGAFEAPVTTEVVPEEPTGDRATEEPMAGAESGEVNGTTSSDDGALMEYEMPTTERSDQPPPASTGQGGAMDVDEQPAVFHDDTFSASEWVSSLAPQWRSAGQQGAFANGSEDAEMDDAGEGSSFSQPDNAADAADGSGDRMDEYSDDETPYALDMDTSGSEDPANDAGAGQYNPADGTAAALSGQGQTANGTDYEGLDDAVARSINGQPIDLRGMDFSGESGNGTTNELQASPADPANELQQDSDMGLDSQEGDLSEPESESDDVPMENAPVENAPLENAPMEDAPLRTLLFSDTVVPCPFSFPAQSWRAQSGSDGSDGSSGFIQWKFIRPATFQWKRVQSGSNGVVFTRLPILQQPPPSLPAQQPSSIQPPGNNVATQGAQSTQPPTSQPTPQPTLRTVTRQPVEERDHNNPLLEQSSPQDAANMINGWVVDANKAALRWIHGSEEEETDAASFAEMYESVGSALWCIKINVSWAAHYLEYELWQFPGRGAAETKLCVWTLPAVEKMRGLYQELSVLKGCPEFFSELLLSIGYVLTPLKERKLDYDQRKNSPQQPPTSQSTPQTGTGQPQRIVLAERGNALQAARFLRKWVLDAIDKHGEWMSKDGAFFDDMRKNPDTEFSKIIGQIGEAAQWIEERETNKPNVESLLRETIRSVEGMRGLYKELGEVTKRQHLFVFLLKDIDRILKELKDIE